MALTVNGLSYSFGGTPVLRRVSLRVEPGEFAVLLGRNGGGKSTLLRLMAGLLPCRAGEVAILGRDLASIPLRERAALIGYLPQFHTPVFPFSVEEVVLTGLAASVLLQPGRRERDRAREALETVGITHLRHRSYTELSGGERQLVLIARVIAQGPRIILLDEPVSHLDLANQARLLALLKRLAKTGIAILAVLHDPNAALLWADRLLLLKGGEIVADGTPPPNWGAPLLSDLYGVAVECVPYRNTALVVPRAGADV